MGDSGWLAVFTGVLGVGVLGGEALRLAGWSPDASRRFVHSWTGFAVALAPAFLVDPAGVYGLAGLFVLVNIWAIRRGLLLGMHGIARKSWGTVVFPIALIVAALGCWTLDSSRTFALQIAFAVLATSDPLAAWVGRRWGTTTSFAPYATDDDETKSVVGSAAFFASAWVIVAIGLAITQPLGLTWVSRLVLALVIAGVATTAELLGRRGWDNLTIVVAVMTPLVAVHTGRVDVADLVVAGGWALGFGVLSHRARFLTTSGALSAGLLAFCVLGLGGWHWALPGLMFFVLSSVLSKVGKKAKRSAVPEEKGSRRDAGQVYANGGLAWVLLLADVFVSTEGLYWGFVGAFAAAAADTWATEIGTYFHGETWSLITGRRVPPGMSGGVSIPGTLGAVAGAATVFLPLPLLQAAGLEAMGLGEIGVALGFGLVVLSGLLASLVDSALGGTVQALYREPGSRRLTERRRSAAGPNTRVRGFPWMDNDAVNLMCTGAGATLAGVGFLLF
jgi:uncharacterized protein (TIGR00297 family)